MDDVEILQSAAIDIAAHGLAKAGFTDSRGRHCMAGALFAAVQGESGVAFVDSMHWPDEINWAKADRSSLSVWFPEWVVQCLLLIEELCETIGEQYPELVGGPGGVPSWNDEESRTADEVVLILEKTAIRLAERVQ